MRQQHIVSPAPFRAWTTWSCSSEEAQNVIFLRVSWGELPSLHGGMLEDRGFVCPRQFLPESVVLRARPLQKSRLTERADTELCWSSEKKQIYVGIMHLFNGLDLKTGLSPPEGFEMANTQASGCSCGVVALRCEKPSWHWWHLSVGAGALGTFEAARGCQADAHQGQVQMGASRCALASVSGGKQTASSRRSRAAMLLFKQPGCRAGREGIVINLAHDF